MAENLLGGAYKIALAAREKRESLGVPARDYRVQQARNAEAKQRIAIQQRKLKDAQESKYGVSQYELRETGPINTLLANGELAIDSMVGRAKHKVAQLIASDDNYSAIDSERLPLRYRRAHEEYNSLLGKGITKAGEVNNPFMEEADYLKGLSAGQRKRVEYLKSMLGERVFVERKLPFKDTPKRTYLKNESFMQRLDRAEQQRNDAIKVVGDESKGIPDMFNSQAKVNPYHQELVQKDIQRNQADLALRNKAIAQEQNASALWAKKDGSLLGATATTAKAGLSLLDSWRLYGADNLQHAGTVTGAYIKHPAALAQQVASSVPDMIGGLPGIAASAGLQAMEDSMHGAEAYRKRTGTNIKSTGESAAQSAFTALNFGANFAENALLMGLARGKSMTAMRGGLAEAIPQTAVTSKVKNLLAVTGGPVTNLTKDIATAYGVNAGAGYIQSKVQQGWGALDFEKDTGRVAIENAVAGGLMATGFAAPTSLATAVMGTAHKISEVKEKKAAYQQATFEDNINPDHAHYNPVEAINKQIIAYNTEGADKVAVREGADRALASVQTEHANYAKQRNLMQKQLDYADALEADVLGGNLPPDLAQTMRKSISDIRGKFDNDTVEWLTQQYTESAKTLDKVMEAHSAFFGMTEEVAGSKTKPTVAKDNVKVLSDTTSTPEAKAKAIEHVKSYPMMYKPDEILKFTSDLSNDLTNPQRTTLRQFAEVLQAEHLAKGVAGVTADLTVGSKNYRKLEDYYKLHSEAVAKGDTVGAQRIAEQFDSLASSFQEKARLAESMFKEVQGVKGKEVQAVRTESGKWKINSGARLSRSELTENGGFELHMGSQNLYEGILDSASRVAKAYSVFKDMQSSGFREAVVPTQPDVVPDSVPASSGTTEPVPMVKAAPTPKPEQLNKPSLPKEVVSTKAPEKAQGVTAEKIQKVGKPKLDSVADSVQEKPLEGVTVKPDYKVEDHPETTTEPDHVSVVESETRSDQDIPEQIQEPKEGYEVPTQLEDSVDTGKAQNAEGTLPVLKGVDNKERRKERTENLFRARNLVRALFKQGSETKGNAPLVAINDMYSSVIKSDNVEAYIEKVTGEKPSEKQLQHLEDFKQFHNNFTSHLSQVFTPIDPKGKNNTYRDMVQFLVQEDGTLPENVQTAMSVSAFNWLLEKGSPNSFVLTDKEILALIGLPTDQGLTVPRKLRTELGTAGMHRNVVTNSIGANALKALQLKTVKKADPQMQERLAASMGTLALHTLQSVGLIHHNTDMTVKDIKRYHTEILQDVLPIGDEGESNEHVRIPLVRVAHVPNPVGGLGEENGQIVQYLESSRQTKGFLGKMFGVDDPARRPDLVMPESLDQQTIKKSKLGIPSLQRKNAEKAMKEPYVIREHMANLYQSLYANAPSALKEILGIDDSEQALKNIHISKRDNAHASRKNEWASLEKALDYATELGEKRVDGKLPKIFFRVSVWSNQRMGFTPNILNMQTSQIHRSMVGMAAQHNEIKSSRVVDDMGNLVSDKYSIFNAQGKLSSYGMFLRALAMGAEGFVDAKDADGNKAVVFPDGYQAGSSVDKAPSDLFLPVFEAYLKRPEVTERIEAMSRVLDRTDQGGIPDKADVALVAKQVAEFGMGAHSLLVLTELARFRTHKGNKPFVTSIGIESDGVTNGPALANMMSGTLDEDLALQFGFIPKSVSDSVGNYFESKRAGMQDYYQGFGALQKSYLERVMGEVSDTPSTARGRVANALGALAGGFGTRGSAKKWATPFNYSAGYPALKKALARELIDSVNKELQDIAKLAQQDDVGARARFDLLRTRINTVVDYHNKFMQTHEKIKSPTEAVAQFARLEVEHKMLFPNDDQMPPRPTNLKDVEAVRHYLNAMSLPKDRVVKLDPNQIVAQVNKVVDYHNNNLVRSRDPAEHIPDWTQNLTSLMDYEIPTGVDAALRRASIAIHGLASEHAIKDAAKDYIQTRNLNVRMNNIAFEAYDVLRQAMIAERKAVLRREGNLAQQDKYVTNTDGTKKLSHSYDLEGLTQDDLSRIDDALALYSPIIVSALANESDNPLATGLFLSKSEKGFDNSEGNAVSSKHRSGDGGKAQVITSGIVNRKEIAPGVGASAAHVQSSDAYVANKVMATVPSTNVHDATITGIDGHVASALAQNKAVFDLLVNYRSQVENLNALVRPLNGLAVATEKFGLHKHITEKALEGIKKQTASALTEAQLISAEYAKGASLGELLQVLASNKFDAEVRKIEFAQKLHAIHQYAGEGGELVLGEAEHRALAHELSELGDARTDVLKELGVLGEKLGKLHDVQPVGEVTSMQKLLAQHRGREIPQAEMLKILEAELKHVDDQVHQNLFKVLKGILPSDLKFEYVVDEWKGSSGAAGWYNPKSNTISIRAVGSKVNFVYPELVLHEMVHAALVSVTTNPNKTPEVAEVVQRITTLRDTVAKELNGRFDRATVNNEEFMAWGLTNPKFQDALRQIIVPKAGRNRKGWGSAFSAFVSNVMKLLTPKGSKWSPNAKDISAVEALIIDSAELIQMVSEGGVDRSYTPKQAFNMVKDANPSELLEAIPQGKESPEFTAHLKGVVAGPVSSLFETLGTDHLKDLTVPTNFKSSAYASLHGLSAREEYITEIVTAVVDYAQDSAANTPTMKELINVYNSARNQLSAENFHDGDWSTATKDERSIAQTRYDSVFKPKLNGDRSTYLATFTGLALGSERFNTVLKGLNSKQVKEAERTFTQKVKDLVYSLMDWATGVLAKTRKEDSLEAKTNTLLDRLVSIDIKKRQDTITVREKIWDGVTSGTSQAVSAGASKIAKALVKLDLANSKHAPNRIVGKLARIASSDSVGELPKLLQDTRNQIKPNQRFGELSEIAAEVLEPSDARIVGESFVRAQTVVQNLRKAWIDNTKRMAEEGFLNGGKDLSKEQHTALTYTLLRTDVQALMNTRSLKDVVKLIEDPTRRKAERARLEREILRLSPNGLDMVHRAQDLGHHMIFNRGADGLVKNAQAIADGVFTGYKLPDGQRADASLVKAIDDLASIHALNYLSADHRKVAVEVIKREMDREDGGNGVDGLLKLHQFAYADSVKNFTDNPYSVIKGYLPEHTHTYRETLNAPLRDAQKLALEGWEMVHETELDPHDVYGTKSALYVKRDSGVQSIVSGGVTFDSTHSKGTEAVDKVGVAEYRQAVAQASIVRSKIPLGKYEPANREGPRMVPQLDANGHVVGFNYEMQNSTRDSLLVRNNNFGDLLGKYVGNNVGREPILEQNKKIINTLHELYASEFRTDPRAYVAIGPKSTDPRLAEIWRMLPHEVKQEAELLWGKGNPMMVRNDLVNLTFGFTKYSLGDLWDKAVKDRNVLEKTFISMVETLVSPFTPKERAQLLTYRGERFIQQVMKKVKDFIVIRSISVLWGNIKANVLLLTAYGVNPEHVVRDTLLSFRAGLSYRKQRALLTQAEEHLRAGIGDRTKWEHQRVTAQDAISRNPLIDFLQEGMMPSIVEDVAINEADYTYQTALNDKMDKYTQRVPKSVRTLAKWVMLSPDTPAYRFLADATQYSDFTSKYVLYKHLSTKKGVKHSEAIHRASSAFINYDVPTSKGLQYVNDMGLVMFTKFFLRFQRVIIGLMRTQPANVLAQHYATEWLTNTPGVLDPLATNRIGWPIHSSILQAPSATADIATLKTLF